MKLSLALLAGVSKAASYDKCPAIATGENESTEMNCADDYCKRNCNDGYQAMKPKKATCMKEVADDGTKTFYWNKEIADCLTCKEFEDLDEAFSLRYKVNSKGQEVYFLECPEGTLFNGKDGKTEQKLFCKCNKKTHVCKWRNENDNIVNKATYQSYTCEADETTTTTTTTTTTSTTTTTTEGSDCIKWSENTDMCETDSECVIPAGEKWCLDADMDVATLTIHGSLIWDTSIAGMTLSTTYVSVENGGYFELGTVENPMNLEATIYIKTLENWDPKDESASGIGYENWPYGSRFFAGKGGSSIKIHGRKLDRTWTLLAQDVAAGDSTLVLKDDPTSMGWQIGDKIGIAATARDGQTQGLGATSFGETHVIAAIDANVITLEGALVDYRWGGEREVQGTLIELAAEVVNLSRSVLFTGDYDDFDTKNNGFHTLSAKGEGRNVYDIRYTRFENCGQQDLTAKYCTHFHFVDDCPNCVLQGNAYENAVQTAITIHSVHNSLVDQNVMWNSRTVGIYIEDGNEMNNTISNNVAICARQDRCSSRGDSGLPWQDNGFGGIYGYGMTNNFIGNRVAGHEAGMWFPGHLKPTGKGGAIGKVCPQFTPFGTFKSNVCHSCGQFGLYLEHQQSRNLQRDEYGFVIGYDSGELKSCEQFAEDGSDNGKISVIEDHLDWHNVYTGGYEMTDIQFKNLITVNQRNHIHWRVSKDLVQEEGMTPYHIDGALFLQERTDDFGDSKLLLPGGNANFMASNVIIKGDRSMPGEAVIMAPEECGMNARNELIVEGVSSLCTTTIALDGFNWDEVDTKIQILAFGGRDAGDATAVSYINYDTTTNDATYRFSTLYDGFTDGLCSLEEMCDDKCQDKWEAMACSSDHFGRLYIWTAENDVFDGQTLQLGGPGYVATTANADIQNVNSGSLIYDCTMANTQTWGTLKWFCGYGAHVRLNDSYNIVDLPSSTQGVKFVLRKFDAIAELESSSITLGLCVGSNCGSCTLHAQGANEPWYGHNGVHENAQSNDCDELYQSLL